MSIVSADIMEAKEVAAELRVSVRTVVRLAERGDIIAFKVGDLWRFHRDDVDNYIAGQKQKQKQQQKD